MLDHSAAFAAWGPVVVELDQVHAIEVHQHNHVIGQGTSMLDVGCGSGLTLMLAAQRGAIASDAVHGLLCSAGGARATEAAGEDAVRDVLERSLAQFQDPETGVVTMQNTFRRVAAHR